MQCLNIVWFINCITLFSKARLPIPIRQGDYCFGNFLFISYRVAIMVLHLFTSASFLSLLASRLSSGTILDRSWRDHCIKVKGTRKVKWSFCHNADEWARWSERFTMRSKRPLSKLSTELSRSRSHSCNQPAIQSFTGHWSAGYTMGRGHRLDEGGPRYAFPR